MKPARSISSRSLRIVASHSAVAGLARLIPVPFVDDAVIRRVTRRMASELFEIHGRSLSEAGAKALSYAPSQWIRGSARSVAMLPLRRVLRKVVYLLAFKDCSDVASTVFHDGWLLARWLERGPQAGQADDAKRLKKVRKAMLRTYMDVDPAPLRRALTGAFLGARVGVEGAVQVVQRMRKPAGSQEETAPLESLDRLVARMKEAAQDQWQYMEGLEQSFRRHLGEPAESDASGTSGAQAERGEPAQEELAASA